MKVIALIRASGERRAVRPPVRSTAIEPDKSGQAPPPGPPFLRGGETMDDKESGRMPLLQMADVAICIPSDDTQHIQEAHLAVEHIICHLVERAIFEEPQAKTRLTGR